MRVAAEALLAAQTPPAEVLRWLKDRVKAGDAGFSEDRIPTLRTLQYWAREIPSRKTSDRWSFADDNTGEPAMVLETLAAVIDYTSGAVTSFEVAEAEFIARLGRAFPDLPPLDRWQIAILYVVRLERGKPTDDIDAYLAFAPWRPWSHEEEGIDRHEVYDRAQHLGWVPPQPRPFSSDLIRALSSGPDRDAALARADALADWQYKRQDVHRAEAMPGAQWVLGDDERRLGIPLDHPVAESEITVDVDLSKIAEEPSRLVQSEAVSNPVSNDARSATGRRRPARPRRSAPQDVADGDE
jgi:hypothetical protein